MKKSAKFSIEVRGTMVNIVSQNDTDYICLTDIARFRNPDATDDLIRNWLRNRNTIEFLGIWEQLHNPGFNPVEFDGIRKQTGLNSFILTVKQWTELTGAIGLISKAGRYGGPTPTRTSHSSSPPGSRSSSSFTLSRNSSASRTRKTTA